MLRRLLFSVILGSTAFVVSGVTADASAAPACSFYLGGLGHLNHKFKIGDNHPTAALNGSCYYTADNYFAHFTVHHVYGDQSYVPGSTMNFQGCNGDWYYGGSCTDIDTFDSYDEIDYQPFNITEPGRMVTYGRAYTYAVDCCDSYYDVYVGPQYFTAKYATRTNLSAVRNGSHVTLTVAPLHYSTGYHGFVGSVSTQVIIDRFSGGAWHRYRMLTTYANAPAQRSVTVYQPAGYDYRAHIAETSTRWASYSTVRRV